MDTHRPFHRPGRQNRVAELLAERIEKPWQKAYREDDAIIFLSESVRIFISTNAQLTRVEQVVDGKFLSRPTTWGEVVAEYSPILH